MARVKELMVNGVSRPVDVDPNRSLLGVLRDDLDLTGAKYGCGEGRCGACTVLVDNQVVRSCMMRVGAAEGKSIATIEGLSKIGQELHPLQQAFLDHDALQCGYCTPGMIMAGVGLLGQNPEPTDDEIVKAMNLNVCRCGTYSRIINAIKTAAIKLKGVAK